jgi:ParB family chromosome partitioning protein
VARRSGLGRGLGALIPTETAANKDSTFFEIPISSIKANPHQPRVHFGEETMGALVASIKEVGVLQPVLVRSLGGDDYELIAGERRWRAARRAGLQTIPALVRSVNEVGSVEQALIENLHREDLNPLEEASAYQQLIEDFGLTQDEVAARVGRSRPSVSNALRLFQLTPSVQRLVAEGELSAGHARALLGTPDRSFQEGLAKRAVEEGLSVRAVEQAVRARNELVGASSDVTPAEGTAPPHRTLRPPGILELEELLSQHLDTRVRVDMGGRRGRVTIEFATLEDLERIYRIMTEPPG